MQQVLNVDETTIHQDYNTYVTYDVISSIVTVGGHTLDLNCAMELGSDLNAGGNASPIVGRQCTLTLPAPLDSITHLSVR